MSLIEYAKSELENAFPNEKDSMQLLVMKNIMELIETFSNQGHSGFSGSYVLNVFDRLVRFKPIRSLTGEDNEWGEPSGEDNTQQNKRYPAVFRKNFDNNTAYNIEGRIFIDEDGCSYTCRDSKVPVTFPYEVPDKPEYVHKNRPT